MERTDVTVPRGAYESGRLPRVCVVSGDAADGLVDHKFHTLPLWVWLLLPLGVLPFIIVAYFMTKTTRGSLPVTARIVRRFHTRRAWMWAALTAALISAAGSVAAASPTLLWLSVALFLAGAAMRVVMWSGFVTARLDNEDQVHLGRVHPRFAAALEKNRSLAWA